MTSTGRRITPAIPASPIAPAAPPVDARDTATLVTLACLWEATAPKPGNVYRGADFEDLTYADFLLSATVAGRCLADVRQVGVGSTILRAVSATRAAVHTNTNLGTLLLLTPLAAADHEQPLADAIVPVLNSLTASDTAQVYQAIRMAGAGGLGKVAQADVAQSPPPDLGLVDAMRLAADRDMIARQYTNAFADVIDGAARQIMAARERGLPLADAIVLAYLQLLARFGDSLVARKCGEAISRQVSDRAARCLDALDQGPTLYQQCLADFDFWLRVDGHRRNPGTTADLIAAGLFVLLREGRITWPVRFYK